MEKVEVINYCSCGFVPNEEFSVFISLYQFHSHGNNQSCYLPELEANAFIQAVLS